MIICTLNMAAIFFLCILERIRVNWIRIITKTNWCRFRLDLSLFSSAIRLAQFVYCSSSSSAAPPVAARHRRRRADVAAGLGERGVAIARKVGR